MTVLVDTHVLQWWTAEPHLLSKPATAALENATEVAVAGITWFELAWLAARERLIPVMPVEAWLDELAARVRTANITPAIAATAARLPSTFPGNPCDRLIYATAIEHGWPLVTKDKRLRQHRHPRKITVW